MKRIFTLVFLLTTLCASAQFGIGKHVNTIRSEAHKEASFEVTKNPDGDNIAIECMGKYICYKYYLNENMICYASVIYPFTRESDNLAAKLFNEKWITDVEYEWWTYLGSSYNLKANRRFTDNGQVIYTIQYK